MLSWQHALLVLNPSAHWAHTTCSTTLLGAGKGQQSLVSGPEIALTALLLFCAVLFCDVADACKTEAATDIIFGLALGLS